MRKRKIANVAVSLVPWPVLRTALARSFTNLLGAPAEELPFWRSYSRETFGTRLAKADVLSNLRNQLEYHERYRFSPDDLAAWSGRVFVIESDNDIFGPARRQALRDTYPQAEVCTFHGAGQAPAFSRAGEYLQVLDRFLAS